MARETYKRGQDKYLLDRSRQFMVRATPEEYVRQDVIDWLITEQGVPSHLIRSEFNQSKRKATGRADIVVFAPESTDDEGDAVLVVECKRPETFLGESVVDQAIGYAEPLNASFILLTSWDNNRGFSLDGDDWKEIDGLPGWEAMVEGKGQEWTDELYYPRAQWQEISTTKRALQTAKNEQEGFLGEDSPPWLAPVAVDLGGLLADDRERIEVPFKHKGLTVRKDLGRTNRNFGNSAGGSWGLDWYRSFVVRRSGSRDDVVVSLAVAASAKSVDHPMFGNSKSHTMLLAAIDGEWSSHLSLQMNLVKTLDQNEVESGAATVRHSGRMTAGKRGRLKNARVVEYVSEYAPDLVEDDKIVLGELDLAGCLQWEKTMPFIANVIRYALLRDGLRAEIRAE